MSLIDGKHAAAALGPDIARIFLENAEPLGVEEARELVPLVDVHMEAAYKIRSSMHRGIDVMLAQKLCTACKDLLAAYPLLDAKGRAAVVGAVRYFTKTRDAANDLSPEGGFEDDALVVNYVIALTGSGIPPVRIE